MSPALPPASGRRRAASDRSPDRSPARSTDRSPARSTDRSPARSSRPEGARRAASSTSGAPSARAARQSSSTKPASAKASSGAASALDAALAAAGRTEPPAAASFADLGVPPRLVEALRRRGLERPFAIQTRALPDALAGRDVLGRAATGSGKTLAFGVPLLARLAGDATTDTRPARVPGAPRALVLVPSRELALQTTATLTPLAAALGLRVTTVVGGTGYARQTAILTDGADVVVATPGRLIDLIERGVCRLDRIEIVAIDEADYMADLGFLPVVTRLLRMTPPQGQRLLFSATLDRGVAGLVETFLDDPAVHSVATATAAVDAMTHRVFLVDRDHKIEVAAQIAARPARTLFFVRTKHGAARLAKQLGRVGVDAVALHGNLAQNARERAMSAFTGGHTRVLVATDVAARGLHVDGVDLVVHYDPPADPKAYVHRSGRTARAGNEGTVVTFVEPDQLADVRTMHRQAAIEAAPEPVGPGHETVRALGESGTPAEVVGSRPQPQGQAEQRPARQRSSTQRPGAQRSGPPRAGQPRAAQPRQAQPRGRGGRPAA